MHALGLEHFDFAHHLVDAHTSPVCEITQPADWKSPGTSNQHSMRFSCGVFFFTHGALPVGSGSFLWSLST